MLCSAKFEFKVMFLKNGFHKRWSRNQKRRAIRFSENQTDGVRSRTLILLMAPWLMIKWKLGFRSRKQKWKNQPEEPARIEHCHWFILPLLLATPKMQFSLDRKRRSHKQNQCSVSDSVGRVSLDGIVLRFWIRPRLRLCPWWKPAFIFFVQKHVHAIKPRWQMAIRCNTRLLSS